MNRTRKVLIVLTAAGLLAALAIGCSASSNRKSASNTTAGVKSSGSDTFSKYALDSTSGSVADGAAGQPAAAPSTDTTGANAAQLPDILGRKIVQSTNIDVKVKEVPRTFQDVVRIATSAGGFVASSSMSNDDDKQAADLTVRVPADQYQSVIGEIRAAGNVVTESSDANDVTEEYSDLSARVRTLQATEQRYIELLAQAANVNDVLTVQDRLDSVRGRSSRCRGASTCSIT